MIEKISFVNYKAFKEGHINLSPITVLMGANSMGKSSILKLILMLSQTNGENKNTHALKSYGRFTDNGEVKNIFHKKNINERISVLFCFKKPLRTKGFLEFTKGNISRLIHTAYRRNILALHELVIKEKNVDLRKKLEKKFHLANDDVFDSKPKDFLYIFKENLKLSKVIEEHRLSDNDAWKEDGIIEDELNKNSSLPARSRDVTDFYMLLDNLSEIEDISSVEYEFLYLKNKDRLVVSKIKLSSSLDDFIEIDMYRNNDGRKSSIVNSNSIDFSFFHKYYPIINSSFDFNGLRAQWVNSKPCPKILGKKVSAADVLYEYVKEFTKKAIGEFNPSNIRHVSPVRAYPKRYYILNEGFDTGYFDTTDHDSLVSNLKDNNDIVHKVNKWLRRFGLSIKIEKLNEIIQAIRVNQNDINLHLVDIGFGVSQILPVIIQSLLAKSGSIILIEQPEIHIHPKMQSELADFFISLAKENNKRFVIETHSEAFLKRLRRRMAESPENLRYSIFPKDVSIHYVERAENKNNGAIVNNKEINSSGNFEWPKEFMANDVEDTIEFMKRQG